MLLSHCLLTRERGGRRWEGEVERGRGEGETGGGKVIMYDFHLIVCRYESGAGK